MKISKLNRFLEILPGLSMWSAFSLPIIFTFIYPKAVFVVMMIFAIHWVFKSLTMSGHLIAGYLDYRREIVQNWREMLKNDFSNEYDQVYHLIIIATYKEELLTLEQSIQALKNSLYDLKKVILVIATEERDHQKGTKNAQYLIKKYKDQFFAVWSFEHPKDIPQEVIGKGGNITYSARQALKKINQLKIKPENIIVTTLDADHRVDKRYLACLTYKYLAEPNRELCSFQPLPMFFNNIWEVPIAMRIIALGSSFWQMIESTREYRLRNFASHAQPLSALIKTDFWSTKTIVEDGHQYWRSWFVFEGNHHVIPIHVPIYQDAVLSHTFWDTVKQQYLQKRRWAWGVSDFPFVVIHSLKHKKISLWKKIYEIYRLFEGNFSWSTTSILLAFVAWVPVWVHRNPQDLFAYNFPLFYSRILTIAVLGMVVTLTIATLIMPPIPKTSKLGKWQLLIEWIATPLLITFTNVIFGAMPAIDSQTRLMLGKYLNKFNVTPKKAITIAEDRHV